MVSKGDGAERKTGQKTMKNSTPNPYAAQSHVEVVRTFQLECEVHEDTCRGPRSRPRAEKYFWCLKPARRGGPGE